MKTPRTSKSTHPSPAVILLGTDTPIGLAVIRDLGRHGYRTIGLGRTATALASYSKYCHHHAIRAKDEQSLIVQIKRLAEEFGAVSLLAISEGDLLMLNRHRGELEKTLTVIAPTAEQLESVLDKNTCQEHAGAVGIRIPDTFQFTTLSEAEDKAATLSYPVVLKWSDPNAVSGKLGGAGLKVIKTDYARNAEELIAKLSPYQRVEIFPMVQEYCPGHGMGQMFIAKDGDVLLEFQHERLHEWPPEGGVSSLCKTVPLTDHEEIRQLSRALLKRLGWSGVAMVEYRYDPANGRYYFMEINGRFWGSLPLAIAAGLPFAAGLVSIFNGKGSVPSYRHDYPRLTSCYWIPETKRLLRLLFRRNAVQDPFYKPDPAGSLLTYLAMPFRPSVRYYVFQWADPMPFFGDMLNIITKIWKRG